MYAARAGLFEAEFTIEIGMERSCSAKDTFTLVMNFDKRQKHYWQLEWWVIFSATVSKQLDYGWVLGAA